LNPLVLTAVPILYKWILLAIMFTCRVRRIGEENIEKLKTQGQPWIYTAWHNNTASAVWAERGQGVAMMASASEDGELIARGIAAFGNEKPGRYGLPGSPRAPWFRIISRVHDSGC
jgi:lysophospholipid acyltransferase (LPLAT)-like uncharacterized protein